MSGAGFSKENNNLIYGNGVDGATGQLLLSGVDANAFAESLLTREVDELTVRLAKIDEAQKAGKLALPFPAREDDLTTTGWGVVFARGVDQDAKDALEPLIEHRRATTGNKVKIFYGEEDGFKPDETAPQFIDRHGADSLTINVDKVPYYMLLVGDPEAIPYAEQRYFSTQYAVGRLDLDSPNAYLNYANAVVAHERKFSDAPLLQLFGPLNRGDRSTPLSLNYLISPLADADFYRPDLERQIFQADAATKYALTDIFARADRPRVIVTATHGVSMAPDHPDQEAIQGALLCQDWPGPEVKMPVEKEHRFAAADVDSNVDVTGAFLFLYACFSGGTPRQDEFWFADKNIVDIKTLAKQAFTASLVRRLLGHTNPPVAVMAHCDRAWGASFYRPSSTQHGAVFIAALRGVLGGLPLGAALGPINTAAASLSAKLREHTANREVIADRVGFAQEWIAERDARGCSGIQPHGSSLRSPAREGGEAMIFCSDPALNQLKDEGYNVIRLPREGIHPLDVLSGTGSRLEYLGALHTVWESGATEPKPYAPRSTGALKGGSSRAIKASLGLSILDDLLAGFGISSPSVKAAFKRARSLTFKYDAPRQWGIEPFHIGEYLKQGDLISNPVLDKHLRDSQLYLISELLLSKTLTVTAEGKTSGEAGVDAGLLEDAVKAKVDVKFDGEQKKTITFAGKTEVAFGFKAFELSFQEGNWFIGKFADPGSVSFDTSQARRADTPPVKFDASLVNLHR